MGDFLTRYDALAAPVTQVAPFGADVEYPTEIAGVPMGSYIEWFRSCSRITVTAHPAIAVPAGFTDGGLPVGLQLVGRHRAEAALLRLAHSFTEASGLAARTPEL
jgi:amidase